MIKRILRAAAVGAVSLALLSGAMTTAHAAGTTETPGFKGSFYIVDNKGTLINEGDPISWDQNVLAVTAPGDYTTTIDGTSASTGVRTFIAKRGTENNAKTYNAYSPKGSLLTVLLADVALYSQLVNGGGEPKGAPAVKATGGDYSLGIAFTTDGGLSVSEDGVYFVHITVQAGTGSWSYQRVEKQTKPQPTATTTTLASSANSAVTGSVVTLTAKVSPAKATGKVEFYRGTDRIGVATASNGVATLKWTATAGSDQFTAKYTGDSAYSASTSAPVTVKVSAPAKTATTTKLTVPARATAGEKVVLTAKVSPSAATGKVTFKRGSTVLGTVKLTKGTATLSTAALKAGSHSITASYAGSTTHAASTSKASKLTVTAPKKFTKTVKPTVSGTAKVGKKLTAKVKAWSPKATFKYQWLANGKAIKGATKASFKLTKSQKGKKITVKVTGSRSGYVSASLTSKATAKVK